MRQTMMRRFALALTLAVLTALFAASVVGASAYSQDQDQANCAGHIFSGRATDESWAAPPEADRSYFGDFASDNARGYDDQEGGPGFGDIAKEPAQVQPCPPHAA